MGYQAVRRTPDEPRRLHRPYGDSAVYRLYRPLSEEEAEDMLLAGEKQAKVERLQSGLLEASNNFERPVTIYGSVMPLRHALLMAAFFTSLLTLSILARSFLAGMAGTFFLFVSGRLWWRVVQHGPTLAGARRELLCTHLKSVEVEKVYHLQHRELQEEGKRLLYQLEDLRAAFATVHQQAELGTRRQEAEEPLLRELEALVERDVDKQLGALLPPALESKLPLGQEPLLVDSPPQEEGVYENYQRP